MTQSIQINLKQVEKFRTAAELSEKLADAFSGILAVWLSADQIEAINRKNTTPEYQDGCCATHEYCDPNEAMIQAFNTVMGRQINFQRNSDIELINSAWSVARVKQFSNI